MEESFDFITVFQCVVQGTDESADPGANCLQLTQDSIAQHNAPESVFISVVEPC